MNAPRVGDHVDGELGRVLRALDTAERAGDAQRFRALCREHGELLDARCAEWLRLPRPLVELARQDEAVLQRHGLVLRRIARELETNGYTRAARRMAGADTTESPWELLHRADVLAEDGDPAGSEAVLRSLLAEMTMDPRFAATVHSRLVRSAALRDDLDTALRHAREAHRLAPDSERTVNDLDDLITARELRRGSPGWAELASCRATLAEAQRLSDRSWTAESTRLLLPLLARLESAPPEAPARRRLAKLYGLLAENHFRTGDLAGARHWTGLALAECRRRGDLIGMDVYTANLAELNREP
ncbi:hypothetical protein CFP65_5874 [Kitasatospora sp. MMS16-BH015]|uniref:hypothetical protein n=1 Tax=Kitasatospora sp. MMS16-BH015 TaxID=2018025 RepID=UPI000CA17696|nr:hypothetical protein [Kitasatospora sp. MMS16-BH015]AUG80555.1 hypothetical protein CFP65_5874 [Kitasatospora sp. MMS16-BH015]